jgi:hypothetical protein
MGILDCLTTVIAISFFGAVELNPLMAVLIQTNWLFFVALKLLVTASVCFLFFQVSKKLVVISDKQSNVFKSTNMLVMVTLLSLSGFMIMNVLNNLVVLIQLI